MENSKVEVSGGQVDVEKITFFVILISGFMISQLAN